MLIGAARTDRGPNGNPSRPGYHHDPSPAVLARCSCHRGQILAVRQIPDLQQCPGPAQFDSSFVVFVLRLFSGFFSYGRTCSWHYPGNWKILKAFFVLTIGHVCSSYPLYKIFQYILRFTIGKCFMDAVRRCKIFY